MNDLVALAPGLHTVTRPNTFLGLRFGVRATIAVLPDGGLWVHSPVALDDALRAQVDALGPVRHLVAPNLFHHSWLRAWVDAFPDARVHGPEGLERKRKDVAVARVLDGTPDPDWGGALVPLAMQGMGRSRETHFLHPGSGTLVSADLVLALPPDLDHAWTNLYARMNGLRGKRAGCTVAHRSFVTERKAARASIDALLEQPFARVVVAHSEVLDGPDLKDELKEAWSWL